MRTVKKIKQTFLVALLCIFSSVSFGQSITWTPVLVEDSNSDQVILHFFAETTESILTMQFSTHYTSGNLEFIEGTSLSLGGFSSSVFDVGFAITLSWVDPEIEGIIFNPDFPVFSLAFERTSPGAIDFYMDGFPTEVEILSADDQFLDCFFNPIEERQILSGKVYRDENFDCTFQEGENVIAGSKVRIENNDFSLDIITNNNGSYAFPLTEGIYTITVLPSNEAWQGCNAQSVEMSFDENTTLNLGLQPLLDCESMAVEIISTNLIRCFDGRYYVNYYNQGTLLASEVYIEIELDEDISYVSSSIPLSSQNGNLLTFQIGDVEIGEGTTFFIDVQVGCEGVLLGQTHCTSATIYPYEDCDTPNPIWDGSSLSLDSECSGESVIFTVINNGEDMTSPVEFIVIEDEIIMMQEPIQLTAGEELVETFQANGSTYRAIVEQSEGHPGLSMPTEAVEGCGENENGEVSLGYVILFPEDEGDPFISRDCRENVGSFDPNDKQGFPKGYSDEHFVEINTDIEYQIRFQNTGTFQAFNVVVLDTLSEHLDPNTLRLGAKSHDYELTIREGNILEFNFENIMLPDSTSDLEGSNGFLQFKISQNVDLPLETVIENKAAIYFDFNEPVITNTVFHTIGEDFLEVHTNNENQIVESRKVNISPNPASDFVLFSVEGEHLKEGKVLIFDAFGKIILEQKITENQMLLDTHLLPNGLYFFEIFEENLKMDSGKIVLVKK